MIYRRGWVPTLYRHEIEKRLKDNGFENWREISKFLCDGDPNTWADYDSDPSQFAYQVVDNTEWINLRDAKFWQRMNRIWFVPIYLLTVPFQWLFRGRVGFESTSKLGALCKRITGLK
ncbi:TPA: hypothetical protein QEG37_002006 [Pluralibacter gergoviae]|nr:hypothetical protein [Pluralibacter gergoviae]HDS1241429.1 hypothetical protein [Pluralibacter gergoviae]HDS1248972.1 hypothetical protein [Pluralibacter gergoviae]HDS1254164.1 hypothetical protein [Pluralibacter gergoviae]HDS1257615.1 hypothetical protein [Pluralibacter gergoviae]